MAKLSDMNPSERRKILAYGDSGTGKTIFALGFVGPIYVFDFDGKISSGAAYYAKDKERLSQIEYDIYTQGTQDQPAKRFEAKLREMEEFSAAGRLPYKTVVLDSFTTFTDVIMKDVLAANPAVQRTRSPTTVIPAMLDYRIQNIHVKNVISRLLAIPANIVVLAHIKTVQDELTGRVVNMPNAPGGLSVHLPVVFEEVYRTYVKTEGQARSYWAQTQADATFMARSQIPGISPEIRLAYDSVKGGAR